MVDRAVAGGDNPVVDVVAQVADGWQVDSAPLAVGVFDSEEAFRVGDPAVVAILDADGDIAQAQVVVVGVKAGVERARDVAEAAQAPAVADPVGLRLVVGGAVQAFEVIGHAA